MSETIKKPIRNINITLTMPIKVTISPGEQESTRSSVNSTSTERGMRPISFTTGTNKFSELKRFFYSMNNINELQNCPRYFLEYELTAIQRQRFVRNSLTVRIGTQCTACDLFLANIEPVIRTDHLFDDKLRRLYRCGIGMLGINTEALNCWLLQQSR